ncbi:copper amine oxidase N-terminal domain-containing protein [Alkalihalophilus marmarensis]|uniref:DUF6612 family protein n=1 Tax=Alkalihalophilus marmarensis TaxID=521377 RepID=UPI00203E0277|nr:copper amine oxidase N-terminal domain-containing protein [Alkalihalophilus marmarensis]
MKRLVIWTMLVACLAMIFSPFQAAAATTTSNVKVMVDGDLVEFDVPATIKEGRTLVPVRGVFELLGLDVTWNQEERTAAISNGKDLVQLTVGKPEVLINGEAASIDVPVTLENNRLLIPLRFVAEQFEYGVDWNQASFTVHITSASGVVVDDVEEFLKATLEADLNSYSADMELWQIMNVDGEEMTMEMDMKMDVVMDPIGFYQYMAMTMEELSGESIVSEAYLTEEGYYVSEMGQWIKYDDDMVEEILQLSQMQMDPMYQYELLLDYAENVSVIENKDTYMMSFSITGSGFNELLNELLGGMDFGIPEEELEMIGLLFENFDISISSVFDKETLFPLSQQMTSELAVTIEGETMQLTQKVDGTYSNFNEIEKIKIPQEVIDSAISFDEYIGQWDLEEVEVEEAS